MKTLFCFIVLFTTASIAQYRTLYVSEEKPKTSAYVTSEVDEKTGVEKVDSITLAFGTIIPRDDKSSADGKKEVETLKVIMVYLASIYCRTDSDWVISVVGDKYVFSKKGQRK